MSDNKKKNPLGIIIAVIVSLAVVVGAAFAITALVRDGDSEPGISDGTENEDDGNKESGDVAETDSGDASDTEDAAEGPLDDVVDAVENTSGGTFDEAGALLGGGSVELAIDLAKITQLAYGYPLLNGTASLKMYFNDTPAAALVAGVNMGGVSALDITAVLDSERLAVMSEVLLGESAYGIAFDDFVNKFESSVFGPEGAYSLGLSAEDIQEMLDIFAQRQSSSEELTLIFTDIAEEVAQCVVKYAAIEKSEETVSFSGNDCETATVSLNYDTDGIYNFCHDLLVYVKEHEALRAYLEANEETLAVSAEYYGDDLVGDFYKELDAILTELENAKANGEVAESDVSVVLTYYISKNGNYLVGISFDATADGETVNAAYFAGPSPEAMTEMTLTAVTDDSAVKFTYTVKENDDTAYAADFTLVQDGASDLTGEISWDKTTGEYSLTVTAVKDTITLRGTFVKNETAAVFVLGSVSYGETVYDLGITVTVTYSDAMPEIDEYTELLTMSEEEFTELIYGIAGLLGGT